VVNVLLTTVGTAGDVVPFLHIGRALKARGHDVTLCTHCHYEDQSRRCGLDFVALDTGEEFERFVQDGPLLNTGTGIPVFLRRHILPRTVAVYETIRARHRPDSVLVTRSAPGIAARLAAEKLGIPLIAVLMTPNHIIAMPIVEEILAFILDADVNEIRAQIGLPPIRDWRVWWCSADLCLGLWPDWFSEPEPDWPVDVTLAGFLWREETVTDDVPEQVQQLSNSDLAPILIAGGTGILAGTECFRVAVEACQLLGRPGIVVARHQELLPSPLPANVRWFKYVPSLSALMTHAGAIIHHGGMGTLSQALAAGIPQLALAAGGDRPDNATRVQRLGVAEFLPPMRWQPELVAESLHRLINSSEVQQRCRELAQRLSNADAAARVCDLIEALVSKENSRCARRLAPNPTRISFVGTYPPRRCGIGTFTFDLATAVAEGLGEAPLKGQLVQIVALNDDPAGYAYAPEVRFEILDQRKADYDRAAEWLNASSTEVVCVQHEHLIFGGREGTFLLNLLSNLIKPVVTTLHNVPSTREPSTALKAVCDGSDFIVVMAQKALELLVETHGVPREKITLIHHGVPDIPFFDTSRYKNELRLAGRRVILTFGLLHPQKGIEIAIKALARIAPEIPDVAYLVVGETHPALRRRLGESYRLSLEKLVQEKGLEEHVIFYNRFVSQEELVKLLITADVYVTPYLFQEQITSGTLAYAIGCGKAIVSTPYWYAQEMLAEERGLLVPFGDAAALAEGLYQMLCNEAERNRYRQQAFAFGRQMIWPQVAARYVEVLQQAIQKARSSDVARHKKAQDLRTWQLLERVGNLSSEKRALLALRLRKEGKG
jgi:UDP:flavonoid glycosyltransferase YjiC (YdhE family)/glycosyltransferase involved in cell wall biosynthesis